MTNHWTLEEALPLIRSLQPGTRQFGFHLTLGGSVLNNGESQKDLDLFFIPLDNGEQVNVQGLMEWLVSLWGPGENMGDYGRPRAYVGRDGLWTMKNGSTITFSPDDTPRVVKQKFNYSGLRIDVFVYPCS